MYDASRYVLLAVLAIPALIAGYFALVFVLALGPVGIFVAVFLGIAAMATASWVRDDGTADRATERTNCRACGAPNPVDADTCGYCEEPLTEA